MGLEMFQSKAYSIANIIGPVPAMVVTDRAVVDV